MGGGFASDNGSRLFDLIAASIGGAAVSVAAIALSAAVGGPFPLWPLAGFALALGWLFGWRAAPAVAVAAAAIELAAGVWFGAGAGPAGVGSAALVAGVQAAAAALARRGASGRAPVVVAMIGAAAVAFAVAAPAAVDIAASGAAMARPARGAGFIALGEGLGALLFAPLVLCLMIDRGRRFGLGTAPAAYGVLSISAAAVIGLWAAAERIVREETQSRFEVLAIDLETALLHRMQAYAQSLDGAAGLLVADGWVSADDWRDYVGQLDIERNLPGINGVGLILPFHRSRRDELHDWAAAHGLSTLKIYPETGAEWIYAILLIEPLRRNREAVGLDIAFEDNRRTAADHARDSGRATVTGPIQLVQDERSRAGFLLLRPFYGPGAPPNTVEGRRAAFAGWVYAPFIGERLLSNLTPRQGIDVLMSVRDAHPAQTAPRIYDGIGAGAAAGAFRHTADVTMMERTWTIEWRSTRSFDERNASLAPTAILALGGLVWTLLGGVFFVLAQREAQVRRLVMEKTEALTAREAENEAVFNNAAVAMIVVDGDGRVLAANALALGALDVDQGFVGRRLGSRFAGLAAAVGDVDGSEPGAGQSIVAIDLKDGRIEAEVHVGRWRTEHGEERCNLAIRDVTAERRLTEELTRARVRLDAALEGGGIGVFEINLASGESVVTPSWRRMLGFDEDEEIDAQREWRERVHPEDLPRVIAADEACIRGEIDRSACEYRIRRKDGAWIWLKSSAMVTDRDAHGVALTLVGTQLDVTARRSAHDAVRRSEARVRAIVDNVADGLIVTDEEGRVELCNPAVERMFGGDPRRYSGRSLLELLSPEETWSDAGELLKAVADHERGAAMELRLRRADGATFSGELRARRIEHHGRTLYCALFRDITDRSELERMKTEFLANVSHELRTPLTSIRGSIGLLTGAFAKDADETAMRLLAIARSNCERLTALVGDLLDLEKLAMGETTFQITTIDLGALARDAASRARNEIEQSSCALSVETPEAPFAVHADPARLAQVIAALVSNAVKFSPEEGVIRIAVAEFDGSGEISVADNGVGVPDGAGDRIFERFVQGDGSSTRAAGGVGLGLHIAREIINKMAGEIGYESEPGKGARFWVRLPLAAATAEAGRAVVAAV